MAIVTSFIISLLLQFAESADTLPNVGYLGRGYDIIKGNPMPLFSPFESDPGFRIPIAKFSYNDNKMTADKKYLIPDIVEAVFDPVCSFESTSSTTTGSLSYSNKLSQSVDASANIDSVLAKAKFSASVDFQEMTKRTSNERRVYETATGTCGAYDAFLSTTEMKVSDHFINQVEALPISGSDLGPYFRFIYEFGTSLIIEINMGSQYSRIHEFTASSWNKMSQDKLDIKAAAEASYAVFTGSANSATQTEKEMAQKFESEQSNLYIIQRGSHPPTGGDVSKWMTNSIDNPYPYYYRTIPIDELITSNYIGSDSKDLTTKRNNMKKALSQYCGTIPGCTGNLTDYKPQLTEIYHTHVAPGGSEPVHLRCPTGSKLLSCGYHSDPGDMCITPYVGAWPNDQSCIAQKVKGGADIYAVCAPENLAGEVNYPWNWMEIEGDDSTADVECSAGFSMTGCSMYSTYTDGNTVSQREWDEIFISVSLSRAAQQLSMDVRHRKTVYPGADGKCHCRSRSRYYNANVCIATCSKNVERSTIYQSRSTGRLELQCAGNDEIVFGCGIDVEYPDSQLKSRYGTHYAYARDHNTCVGYAEYEADYKYPYTLYALCGRFK